MADGILIQRLKGSAAILILAHRNWEYKCQTR